MRYCLLLLLLPLLLLPARTNASTPVSVGYYKVMDFGFGSLSNDEAISQTVDSKGNVFILSFHPSGQFYGWVIQKFDPAGLPIWRKDLSMGGPPVAIKTDASGNLALLGFTWTGFNTDTDMLVSKLDSVGNVRWVRRFDGGAHQQDFPMDIYIDPNGGVKAAVTATDISSRYFSIVCYDKDGNDGVSFSDHSLPFAGGHFTPDGHFILSGQDQAGAYLWEYLDPSFQTIAKESFAPTANTSQSYDATVDPLGNLHVVTTIIDKSTNPATHSYSTRTLSSIGVLVNFALVSNAQELYIVAADSANTYIAGHEAGQYVLKKVDSNGVAWTVVPNTNIYSITADGQSGVVVLTKNQLADPFTLQKYAPDGTKQWSVNLTPSPSLTNILYLQPPIVAGGAIHCLLRGQRSATGDDVIAASYVEGKALKAVSSASAQVKGGTPFLGSVNLNLADMNKEFVRLGSNAPSLVSIPATVTVPANLSTAGFQAYAAIVDTASPVTLYAEDGGILRSTVVTVLPASISTCNLKVASLKGGLSTTLTVTLDGPTGIAGRSVTLKSSDTSIAALPAKVVIAPGSKIATVTVKTVAGKTGTVTISATALGVTKSATLSVTP